MNSVWNATQWFVQFFVQAVSFSVRIVAQWNAICFLEAKRSLACNPLQYVITEHVINICYPVTNENKDASERSLHGPVVLVLKYFSIGDRIRRLNYGSVMCWKIWMVIMHEYLSAFQRVDYGPLCAWCTPTVPDLCWIHSVPKSQAHNPIRDTWLVELIRAGDNVFHLWFKSLGPVS